MTAVHTFTIGKTICIALANEITDLLSLLSFDKV